MRVEFLTFDMSSINNTKPLTEFQRRVLEATQQIPRGQVTTYGRLAKYIGCKSPRAIGQALKRNPDVKTYFCHRVLPTTLTLGGYFGKTQGENVKLKERRLNDEGIYFNEKGKLDESVSLYSFNEFEK